MMCHEIMLHSFFFLLDHCNALVSHQRRFYFLMKEKFKGSGTTENEIRQYDNFLTTKGFDYKKNKTR